MNSKAWAHKQLLRNIADAVACQRQQWSPDELQDLLAQPLALKDSVWQLIPVSEPRIEHAASLGFKGHYFDESAAADLFFDFTTTCEQVTLNDYAQQYPGGNVKQHTVDANRILALNKSLSSAEKALTVYLGSSYTGRIIEFDEPMEAYLLKMNHQQVIDWIRNNLLEYREAQKAVDDLLNTNDSLHVMSSLIDAGVDISSKDAGFKAQHKTDIRKKTDDINAELELYNEKIYSVDRMFFRRMTMAIDSMTGRDKSLARQHLTVVQAIGELSEALQALAGDASLLRAFLSADSENTKVSRQIKALSTRALERINTVLSDAMPIMVSGEITDGVSLRDLILSDIKLEGGSLSGLPAEKIADSIAAVQQTVVYHYSHALGQLAELCHKAEVSQNLRPLKLFAKEAS